MTRTAIIEITRKPTPRMVEALRTGAAHEQGVIEPSAATRTHEGLVGRGMADWVSPDKLGRSVWGAAVCVITDAGRDYLAKLDGAQREENDADVIETPAAERFEASHYRSPQSAGTHARAYFTETMIKVGVREDGSARRVHGMECRACGAAGTRDVLLSRQCTPEREAEIKSLRAITDAPTREGKRAAVAALNSRVEVPAVDHGAALEIESQGRGEWHVMARPSDLRVTTYSLPNRKSAMAARDAIAGALPQVPWGGDADALRAAVREFRSGDGDRLSMAIARALAAVPAADPNGWNASSVRQSDKARTERAARIAREVQDGFTEDVKLEDVCPGDVISFRYMLLRARWGWTGLPKFETGPGSARTVTVRATVAGEGRIMTRSGNNYDEGVDGLRFPLSGATWFDDAGNTGTIDAAVSPTCDWLYGARRRPAAAVRRNA